MADKKKETKKEPLVATEGPKKKRLRSTTFSGGTVKSKLQVKGEWHEHELTIGSTLEEMAGVLSRETIHAAAVIGLKGEFAKQVQDLYATPGASTEFVNSELQNFAIVNGDAAKALKQLDKIKELAASLPADRRAELVAALGA